MTSSIFDGLSPADVARIRSAGTALTLPRAGPPSRSGPRPTRPTSSRRARSPYAAAAARSPSSAPGQLLGEAAILNRSLRSASVVAMTPLRVVHLTGETLERLVGELPAFAEAVRSATAERQDRS